LMIYDWWLMIWLNAAGRDFLLRLAVSDLGLSASVFRPRLAPGWAGPAKKIPGGMLICMKHTGLAVRLYTTEAWRLAAVAAIGITTAAACCLAGKRRSSLFFLCLLSQ
jgi:hypothetical protein